VPISPHPRYRPRGERTPRTPSPGLTATCNHPSEGVATLQS
jgi:hypothetical protein